ncbi:MAG TPA: NUDIX domain-containing protein [Methanosarcina sp.]|nr:NUDIX domain-containing protein [Methanosarcina sp.]
MISASGILFVSQGKCLLLKRCNEESHPKEWALPGGHIEEGETAEQAARREFMGECGYTYTGILEQVMQTNDGQVEFTTFLAVIPEQFQPKLNEEHTAYIWADLDDYPNKTMPQVKSLLALDRVRDAVISSAAMKEPVLQEVKEDSRADSIVTETDIAKQIRDKSLTSPQKFGNVWLFALRISGTGLSYRPKLDEYVQRLPENYLSEEFLERCNGLPVIWIHPPKDKLDSESFAERVIGTICLPYIEGDEVWGIAKIFDESAANQMSEVQLSTSPGVVFQAGTNVKVQLQNGSHVLIEGKPSLVDHLAIVENGVWDKGGEPSGVLTEVAHAEMAEASRADSADQPDSSIKGDAKMAEETVAAPAANPAEEMLALLKGIAAKQEAIESRLAALEAEEAEEAEQMEEVIEKKDESMPAPIQEPVGAAKADAEVQEAPAYVADMKARLDAAEKELGALKANAARQDDAEESAKFAEAQKKADDVEQAYGDSAPRPLQGEDLMAYRKRLLGKHLPRSEKWKGVSIGSITDPVALSVIEEQVYADSLAAAHACVGVADDVLIPFTRDLGTGRKITEFRGKTSFVKAMSPQKMYSKVNRQPLN